MKLLSVLAIGLLLTSAAQLGAQTADPFGPIDNKRPRVDPASRKPTRSPKVTATDRSAKRAASQGVVQFAYVPVGDASAARSRIERALNVETTFDYLDQPLKEVVDDISFSSNIPIVIDTKALEDSGIDRSTPITVSLKGVSLRSALRLTLGDLELAFIVRNEVLQITTQEVAASTFSTRFYPVADLLPPSGEGEVLVDIIKSVVSPSTWSDSGGRGTVVYVDHLESLILRQTDEVFHEIDQLLAATKRIAEKQRPKERAQGGDPFQ